MAKTIRRKLGIDEAREALSSAQIVLAAQANGPGDKFTPLPKPPLFTQFSDVVDFNDLAPGKYDPASFYQALKGNDTVHLPDDQATASALGYNALKIFHGDAGNDSVTGGALNDLIMGDLGNDTLVGAAGNDGLTGGSGNDQLIGDAGNDIIMAGIGIDYVVGGAGNDLILAKDADDQVGDFAPAPVFLGKIYDDFISAGSGDDIIFATNSDDVDGGAGNDTITLNVDVATSAGGAVGWDGNDTITGSGGDDWIATGIDWISWPMADWNPANKSAHGGFSDLVESGDGDDTVMTMMYCNATVDTGRGHDQVFVHGLMDIVSTGLSNDELYLNGGATKADLGAGDDFAILTRSTYDNPNHSEITLGAGKDHIHINTDEWFTNGDKQAMGDAPVILDFKLGEDIIDHIWITNLDDASQSLDADYIKCISVAGGAALIYDDPIDNSRDFVFAKFDGLSAQALQTHIDLNTQFL
ncbi:MAG TPA: calcium-binding protein [Dongiaceae bacterium]|nr:calcium-binding protein [Dongiaceae bacterium]